MKPSVGRIVHYQPEPGSSPPCRAALVTAVWADRGTVDLTVFPPLRAEAFGVTDVPGHEPVDHLGQVLAGTWHWPERVED